MLHVIKSKLNPEGDEKPLWDIKVWAGMLTTPSKETLTTVGRCGRLINVRV